MQPKVVENAINLAKTWQNEANKNIGTFEKTFHTKMKKMLKNPTDKVLLIELMDQCFRTDNTTRVADQIEYIFQKYGAATFFTSGEKFLIYLFRNIGVYMPNISVPLFINTIREETKTLVIKGESDELNTHLKKRKNENIQVGINLIGEIVIGEKEANERIDKYIQALKNPNISYLSIKLSTIFSQINPISHNHTIAQLVQRLSKIYSQAKTEDKYVHLDMEEYRDLDLTYEAFTQTLDKEEFGQLSAGIVLQAYLPDSQIYQQKLTTWAKDRVAKGGKPIKIRVVKGANMEMEQTESSIKDWNITTYEKKLDTDSNYKAMIEYGLDKQNAPYVKIAVASHNLFELAYAVELGKQNDTTRYLSLEMLEGMSEAVRVAICKLSHDVTLYTPAAKKDQWTNAIAYLVRRLDENTSKDNFMRYSFGLQTNSKEWQMLQQQFVSSIENRQNIFVGAKRDQDRTAENWQDYKGGSYHTGEFTNEPDTDFVLSPNKRWAEDIRTKWRPTNQTKPDITPLVVANKEIRDDRQTVDVIDKSQYKDGIICGKVAQASKQDLIDAVAVAKKDIDGWRSLSHKQRHEILQDVANMVRHRRGDLIGVAAAEVGKVFSETDVEVSEAVDFIEFYAYSARYFEKFENLHFKGLGVGVVVSPWNFPIAIALGGVASILASGNCCIIKPASASAMCAYELCKCFWDAGVSKNSLQYVPCSGMIAGKYLINNTDVDFVILTGGEDTAYNMLRQRPQLYLTAETGGKNATIVTAMADKEQAIKNIVHSAFSNSGQKCSATSLLILEAEVYDDKSFQDAIVDATKSLDVGSVWEFKNRLGTMATKISGDLKYAVENLDKDEYWALEPKYIDENPYMLAPAIRYGVKDGAFCHMTELFGPVLSVMRADDLDHAIQLVNKTGFGLTSGIETLDEREATKWKNSIKAGNLYINRSTTGAVVMRQPFGGMGKSAIGAGRKVGFYNYITQFVKFKEKDYPTIKYEQKNSLTKIIDEITIYEPDNKNIKKLNKAVQSYLQNYQDTFTAETDYFKLRGEDNLFRYIPLDDIVIRVSDDDSVFEVFSRILAAHISKVGFTVSIDDNKQIKDILDDLSDMLPIKKGKLIQQNDEKFATNLAQYERIIYSDIKKVPDVVFKSAAKTATFITRHQPLMDGRLELLNYFKEQAISHSYHRYGNLGARAIEV